MCPLIAFLSSFDFFWDCQAPLRPKGFRSPLTYRARAGAPRTLANARRWVAGGVLVWLPVRAGAVIIVLYPPAAKPPHPTPPQGEGGRGEGGAPTTAPKRPKGEGAPQGGAGRGRAAERGRAAHDSGPPERRKPDPQGRADRRTPNQTKTPVLFSSGGRNARTINKTLFLLGSSGGCRRRTLAAEHRGRLRGAVGRKKGGYYDTPPRERLVTT